MLSQALLWGCLLLAEMLLIPEEIFRSAKYPIPGKLCLQHWVVMHKCLYCLATGRVDFAVTFLFSIMASWKMLGMVIAAFFFSFLISLPWSYVSSSIFFFWKVKCGCCRVKERQMLASPHSSMPQLCCQRVRGYCF